MTTLAARRTGSPLTWGRDLALIGGVSSFVLPSMMVGPLVPAAFPWWAAAAGAGTGLLLGLAAPALLDLVRGRVPLLVLVLLAPLVGAAWGGLSGSLAGAAVGGDSALLGLLAGSTAGAVQLGIWWFPYTFQTVLQRRRWPVVLACVLTTPLLLAPVYLGTLVGLGLLGSLQR